MMLSQSRIILIALLLGLCILRTEANSDDEFAEFDDNPADTRPTNQDSSSQGRTEPTPAKVSQAALPSSPELIDRQADYKSAPEPDQTTKFSSRENSDARNGHHESADKSSPTRENPNLVNKPPVRIVYGWESYYIEFAFLLALLFYFINYFVGRASNHNIACQWYEKIRPMLKQQFSLVGGAPSLNDGTKKSRDYEETVPVATKQRGLIKSSESVYNLWCSGRVGMDGLLIEISLLKRQDLLSMAQTLIKPTKDTMFLRFLLNNEGYENFVFCIAHKSQATKMVREMVDINTFCPKRKPLSQCGIEGLDKFLVMSELSDASSFILDQDMGSFLMEHNQAVNFIHITDRFSVTRSEDIPPAQRLVNSKRLATFSFNLSEDSAKNEEYIDFSLNLLDRLRRFKLAKDSKQKSEKNRQKITDIIQKAALAQRQEAAQAKKEELRRLEKEQIYNEDDPEKQKKWEKKEAKRELKKNKMRMKQLKVKSI